MNSFTRWWEVARREAATTLRRPASWVLFGFLVLAGFTIATVSRIASGDPSLGGEVVHVTSMFNQAGFQSATILIFGVWFLALSAGVPVIKDHELGVMEVLRSTRLTEREYVWGKFAGALGACMLLWLLFLCLVAGYNHLLDAGGRPESIGPFSVWNYVLPTLLFGLPQILFLAGVPLLVGVWTRRPLVVLDRSDNHARPVHQREVAGQRGGSRLGGSCCRDLSGGGWLQGTYFAVDRGVEFYNTALASPRDILPAEPPCSLHWRGCWPWLLAARRYGVWMRRGGAKARGAASTARNRGQLPPAPAPQVSKCSSGRPVYGRRPAGSPAAKSTTWSVVRGCSSSCPSSSCSRC